MFEKFNFLEEFRHTILVCHYCKADSYFKVTILKLKTPEMYFSRFLSTV